MKPERHATFRLFLFLALAASCAGAPDLPSIALASPSAIEIRNLRHHGAVVRVNVGEQPSTDPPVAGRTESAGTTLRFVPLYPLEPGRAYFVRVEAGGAPIEGVVRVPARASAPSVRVLTVFPGLESVPENLLRLYVYFSGPMGRAGGVPFVKILDQEGREVVDPFLPVEGEFWTADYTRYTLFFDPGRVKTGILPNERMGRPLRSGRRYTLVVSRDWKDAHGQPLVEEYRRTFVVGPAIARPIDLAAWTITPPRAGSRDPLEVTFPWRLDRALLERALDVERGGTPVRGTALAMGGERGWRFVPDEPWGGSTHALVVFSILEDPSGNRIGRAFEVEGATRGPSGPDRHTLTWSPRQ